ncbi:glutamate ligase domain-containing protein [Shigella flexneri]
MGALTSAICWWRGNTAGSGLCHWRLLSSAARLPVCGRMEVFTAGKPTVVVDYAHTPDALEKALSAARLHTKGKLWCVFGCGGDRDKGKRPLMGAIAEQESDVVVITDDNPRSEEPQAIMNDIMAGLVDTALPDPGRAEAVTFAVMQAKPDDVVLVAGKGHEDYQLVGSASGLFRPSDRRPPAGSDGMIRP